MHKHTDTHTKTQVRSTMRPTAETIWTVAQEITIKQTDGQICIPGFNIFVVPHTNTSTEN